ncbi:MAG: foldase protein PrsA [Flavobacteriales bacterium]
MNRILILLSLFAVHSLVVSATGKNILPITSDEPSSDDIVLTVGPEDIPIGEFEAIFSKNNNKKVVDEQYLDEYADLFIDFKRKVLYAQENQMDTSATFKKELAGYRKQLSRPYLTDQSAEDELVKEAYQRMQYEVKASHILLTLDQGASDEDTLRVYNEINSLRSRIIKGESFSEVAKANSQDPSAKTNGGNLGYFSAFRMVYPFESVAYNTPIGSVSKPFRTQFGYHILKVKDKRPSRGEVKVAHIMIEERDDATPKEIKANQEKLVQLQESFSSGKSFEEMTKFSDDKGSNKKNGELPWFGAGQMVPEFENVAFALQSVGEVSQPVQTMYGWHVIKLLDKRGVPSFEDSEETIKKKIKRDARSNRGIESLIAKIKKEYNFTEKGGKSNNPLNSSDFYIFRLNQFQNEFEVDNSSSNIEQFCKINYKNWDRKNYKTEGRTMFLLDGIKYTQDDFADYLAINKITADSSNTCPEVRKKYDEWVNKTCLEYEDSKLEEKYPEFRALMKEYHDGIMLFNLMDNKVWSKAINDTIGLLNYYNLTKENYRWDERADAKVYTSSDEVTASKVRTLINNRYNAKVLTSEELAFLSFGKGEFYMSDDKILTLINRYQPNRLKISNKSFEKGESMSIDNHWYKGLTENEENLDGSIFFSDVNNIRSGGLKSFDEAKGEVITNYQDYLEDSWKLELAEKYPATVNKKVLYSLKKNDN